MSDPERREILEKVASGEISPEDAADLLGALDKRASAVASDEASREVTSIRVSGTFRTLIIDGDPSVRTAVAEGPHRVHTDGTTMIFDTDLDEDEPSYVVFGPRGERRSRRSVEVGDINVRVGRRGFRWDSGRWNFSDLSKRPALTIRMNPDLPLEVQMTAGSARVRGIHGPIVADLTAGSARFEGVRSPFRAEVEAGSVSVSGLFDRGESSVRCTAGSVRIRLERGSSVRIVARTTMGKVALPDNERWQGFIGGGKREYVVGSGEGNLDLEAITGAVAVEAD